MSGAPAASGGIAPDGLDGAFFFFAVFFVCVFFFVVFALFFVLEIHKFLFVPGAVAEQSVGDGAFVDDDFLGAGLEFGAGEVAGGGLQGVEQEGGGAVFDCAGEQQAHDLHERDLDGVGVFEDGEFEGKRGAAAAGLVGVELDTVLLPLVMEEAVAFVFESGGAAEGSVNLDVLATGDVSGIKFVGITHEWTPAPSARGLLESWGSAGTMMKIYDRKGVTGKI